MFATVIGISGVILIILLAQYARIQREVRRVQRARQHEAAIKEFEELCKVSPYNSDKHRVVKEVRHVLHDLAKEHFRAIFAHEIPRAELARKKRLRIHELAAYFHIDVRNMPDKQKTGSPVADQARTARFA